nr:metallophosphoesterase [Haliscomenobacter sp.]
MLEQSRRKFLRQVGALSAGAGLIGTSSIAAQAETVAGNAVPEADKPFNLTILQTTDVHCQVHPHDELFWENEQIVFRKTGGYAQLATYLKKERKKNPYTFVLDTGDMFQGSELSIKTTGKAMVPILNQLEYDLYLPGNWEVIYHKKMMQTLLGSLKAPKVCANMYHDPTWVYRSKLPWQTSQNVPEWITFWAAIRMNGYASPSNASMQKWWSRALLVPLWANWN